MIFALIGNQNCGKTTLFNALTGLNQHTGNFPGVTVEKKIGKLSQTEHDLVDLPGIYSLRALSQDEILTREHLLKDDPDAILNIVDAANLERNLYLTLQLLALERPMVVALNRMDAVRKSGISINIPELERRLGVPVVPICAAKGEGLECLVDTLVRTAKEKRRPGTGNVKVNMRKSTLVPNADEDAVSAQMRYRLIGEICRDCVGGEKQKGWKFDIDRIAVGRFTAYPMFFGILFSVFFLTFRLLGPMLSDLLGQAVSGFARLTDDLMTGWNVHPMARSLVIDGVFAGVGSAVSFLPVILVLFFFLSLLEDTGYMARVALIMDKPMGNLGLSGKSFVPLLLGFGCTVPAVLAARTLSDQRDRMATVLLVPFMSCSAKIPVYTLFAAAFFPGKTMQVMCLLYGAGILVGILAALILKRMALPGKETSFLLELPDYRLPTLKNVTRAMWEKAKGFLEKAFTVILLASVVIWLLQTFDLHLRVTEDSGASILAFLGKGLAPLFAPLGFGIWQAVTALVAGFTAKEAVVSTFGVLLGVGPEQLPEVLINLFSARGAAAFLTFTLLYTPCVAAMSAIGGELGSRRKALCVTALQCVIAWLAAFFVYQIAPLLV